MDNKTFAKKTLLIITSSFPYGMSEAFITKELELLSKDYEITVMPIYPRGKMQDYSVLSLVRIFNWSYNLRGLFNFPFKIISNINLFTGTFKHSMHNLVAIFVSSCISNSKLKFDHIHAHFASAPSTLAMLLSKYKSKSWSFTAHRWDIYDGNCFKIKNRTVSFVRAISYLGSKHLAKRGFLKEKIIVERLPIDSLKSSVKNKKTNTFLFPANLIDVKGHLNFLRLSKDCLLQNDIKIHLAGEGPLKDQINKFLYSNNLSDSVKLLGHVNQKVLHDNLKKGVYDCVILPSLDLGSGLHEGVPASLLEAITHGVPVLASNTGSIPELFTNGQSCDWIFDPTNKKELVDSILYIISNSRLELYDNQISSLNPEFLNFNLNNIIKQHI